MRKFVKIITAAITIVLAGFYGIIFFFADLGRGETMTIRLLWAFMYFFSFGFIVSFLSHPSVKKSYFLIWALAGVFLLNLPGVFAGTTSFIEAVAMVSIPFSGLFLAAKLVSLLKKSIKHKIQNDSSQKS